MEENKTLVFLNLEVEEQGCVVAAIYDQSFSLTIDFLNIILILILLLITETKL